MDPIKVAIADANTLTREGIKRILGAESDLVVVGEAANDIEAADMVQRARPDILLLDLEIPQRKAVPILLALKQKNPLTKVIILSRLPDQESILDTGKAGARGYIILKSLVPSTLIRAIRMIHAGEIWVDKQVACANTFIEFVRQAYREETRKLETEISRILSKRELEILALVANGLTNREISKRLFISVMTVKIHLNHIFGKLDVHNRIQATLLMLQQCGELVKQIGLKYQKSEDRGSSGNPKPPKSELSPQGDPEEFLESSTSAGSTTKRISYA